MKVRMILDMPRLLAAPLVVLGLTSLGIGSLKAQDEGTVRIIDFGSDAEGDWSTVNDAVMGGLSAGNISTSGEGVALFEGSLSLENNGGFASVRTGIPDGALAGFSRLVARVRGDGKRYQLRLRMDRDFDGIAYVASFETTANEWITVELPLGSFEPSFRGYRPRNAEPLDVGRVRQIGIMITDKQEGDFRLEIAWIGANRGEEGE